MPFMAQTYDAVYVIALAAAKANSTDPTGIRDALRDIANPPGQIVGPGVNGFQEAFGLVAADTGIDYQGAWGPMDFAEKGDVLQGTIDVWQIDDGEIVDPVCTLEVDLGAPPSAATNATDCDLGGS